MPNQPNTDIRTRDRAGPVSITQGAPRFVKGRGGSVKRRSGATRIGGYAAVFYDGTPETEFRLAPGIVERIMPGAFDKMLESGADVLALFNHDKNLVLGRRSVGTLELSVDEKGLEYRIEPGKTTVGSDVIEHVTRGDVQGSSFSFLPTVDQIIRDGDLDVIEVRGVTVFDVGPVTRPAYAGTEAELRSVRQRISVRDLSEILDRYKKRALEVWS